MGLILEISNIQPENNSQSSIPAVTPLVSQGIDPFYSDSKLKAQIDRAKHARSFVKRRPGPKGYIHKHNTNPTVIARKFKAQGLDWMRDFATAIQKDDKERIQLWLKLLPYLVTGHRQSKPKRWNGKKASKAALLALEALERG